MPNEDKKGISKLFNRRGKFAYYQSLGHICNISERRVEGKKGIDLNCNNEIGKEKMFWAFKGGSMWMASSRH